MKHYVTASLETHMFFARIMKEHALFLLAGFQEKEMGYKKRADELREQFEDLLRTVVALSNGLIGKAVLESGETVTRFTEKAERQTACLTGIPIDVELTQAQEKLLTANPGNLNRGMIQQVRRLNRRVVFLLNELIAFKEKLLREIAACRLYTTNYPLLIEHILREARLYRQRVMELERNRGMVSENIKETELFWNQIMMEHAQFIRGLLDPTECELMDTACGFAEEYCLLLEELRKQDCRVNEEMTKKIVETTEQYRDFKAAGAEGLTECRIRSIILPLLADHVLREANHYLRLLKEA